MPFEDVIFDAHPPATRLVVVCLSSDVERVRAEVSIGGFLDWERGPELKLVVVRDRLHPGREDRVVHQVLNSSLGIMRMIDRAAPPGSACRILIVGRIPWEPLPANDLRSITAVPTMAQFQQHLPAFLRQAGVDWITRAISKLTHFHFSTIDSQSVQAWLGQFEKLRDGSSSKGWIGHALLSLLDVRSSAQIGDALLAPPRSRPMPDSPQPLGWWLKDYEAIICWETAGVKSAAIVARHLAKRCGNDIRTRIKNFTDIALLSPTPKSLILFEDCLISGKECLERLVKILHSPWRGFVSAIHLKFGISTSLGIECVKAFLKRNDLEGIVLLDAEHPTIDNLTDLGREAARNDRLFAPDFSVISEGKLFVDGIALRGTGVLNSGQRSQVRWLAQVLGRQLMSVHFARSRNKGEAANAASLAPYHALGLDNLGLLTVFAHGVPDATLPVYWVEGPIEYNGVKLEWKPLFSPTEYFVTDDSAGTGKGAVVAGANQSGDASLGALQNDGQTHRLPEEATRPP